MMVTITLRQVAVLLNVLMLTANSEGDPHFLISSSDADNTHLCFEVDGRDGDVLVLVQDSDFDLQVNGELFASKVEEFNKAFFSAIAVLCGDDEIIATNDNITINGLDIVDWDETYSVDLMNEGTVTSYDHSSARINLASDVQLEVTRSHTVNNETYLGFFITHGGGLGDGTTGVIGRFIESKFTAFPTIDSDSDGVVEFSELPITIPANRVTRYSRSHREQIECWHYKVDSDAREDVLLGTREEYTVDDLRDTPF